MDAITKNIEAPWESNKPFTGLAELFYEQSTLKVPRAGRCIEIGSSSSSIFLAEQGYRCTSVNISQLAIERALLLENSNMVDWIQADILSDDLFATYLKESSYDFLFDMQFFHFLRSVNEAKAANTMFKLLKQGAFAVVVTGATNSRLNDELNSTVSLNDGPPQLSLEELRRPLEEAGFTTIRLTLTRFDSTNSPNNTTEVKNNETTTKPITHSSPSPSLAWMGIFQKIIWDSNATYALEVQEPFSRLILDGQKTIETRAYPLPFALLNIPILLLESAEGTAKISSLSSYIPSFTTDNANNNGKVRIIGTVTFTSCVQYKSFDDWNADRDHHKVPLGSAYDWKQETHCCQQYNQTIEEEQLPKYGKINELWAWKVRDVSTTGYNNNSDLATTSSCCGNSNIPALQRVHRSLFQVMK